MKVKVAASGLLLILLASCSSLSDAVNYFREVGYTYTSIQNVNERSISFSNGMGVRTNRMIIAVNQTPVFLVIENYTGSGYFYLKKQKVRFSGNGDIEMMGLSRGVIQYVFDLVENKRTIILADGSEWLVPRDEDWKKVGKWITDSEIIIPDNRPPEGDFFINPATLESILAFKLDKPAEDENEN